MPRGHTDYSWNSFRLRAKKVKNESVRVEITKQINSVKKKQVIIFRGENKTKNIYEAKKFAGETKNAVVVIGG